MKRLFPAGFALFTAGGLLSGLFGVSNLSVLVQTGSKSVPAPSVTASQVRSLPAAYVDPTPSATGLAVVISPASAAVPAADSGAGWSYLYVVRGDLWEAGSRAESQLTQGSQISQPVLSDDAIAFVKHQRNASDVWLASADGPPQPITQNASPIIAQNHWASQPVFAPGRQRLYVVGDFNKSSTGPGGLAIWELSLHERTVVQITNPPAYAGGDQDVAVNPEDPRQIIFTRYAYAGTRLLEQLQWLDVSTRTLVALTQPDQRSRQASYSPDGMTVAFVQSGQGANQDLYVARIPVSTGGAHLEDIRQVVTGVIANPVWSPDGTTLAYIALMKEQFQIWSLAIQREPTGALSFGQPRQITSGPGIDATSRPVFMPRDQASRIRDWLTPPSAGA